MGVKLGCSIFGQAMNKQWTLPISKIGQVMVSINKHIQTETKQKNNNKRQDFKNSNFSDSENDNKQQAVDQYQDNLKTTTDKNYNEPL